MHYGKKCSKSIITESNVQLGNSFILSFGYYNLVVRKHYRLKMTLKVIFLIQILTTCFNIVTSLVFCNETVTKLQICQLGEHDKGQPPWKPGQPLRPLESMTIFSVAEFNEAQNTISLDILLSVWWNDTRISLKSNDPQKYTNEYI